jgi:hypothetical protein
VLRSWAAPRDASGPETCVVCVGPVGEERSIGLRSQNATLKGGRGRHRKYLPYAFTEHGVAMLSSILSSGKAIQVNVATSHRVGDVRNGRGDASLKGVAVSSGGGGRGD